MANTKKYVSLDKLSLYNEKIKKVISDADAATLASAKSYADGLGVKYDAAGLADAALADAKSYADGKDAAIQAAKKAGDDAALAAAAADEKAVAAQNDVDALETYVGAIPDGATSTNVVAYVQEKTAGIATSENLLELTNRVSNAETDIDNIEKDYLKTADKTELKGLIEAAQTAVATEKSRAEGIEGGLETRLKAVEDDCLKAADKTELEGKITTNANAIERLTNGVSADEVDGVNDLIQYVKDHGTEVTGMQEDISDNAEAIAGVAERMDTAEGKITALETASATHALKADVEALEEADTEMSGRLDALEAKFGDGDDEGSVADLISDAIDAEESRVDGLLANKVDKVEGKGLSTNDLTNELKANYDAAYTHSQVAHAPADAQANVIESVKVNGTVLTVTGKAVDISVPTKVSELTNDVPYLVAADIADKADKATTLAGYGIEDAYTKTETDTAISNAMAQFVECSEEEINALFV